MLIRLSNASYYSIFKLYWGIYTEKEKYNFIFKCYVNLVFINIM